VLKLILINAIILQLRIKKLVYHIFDESSSKGLEECFIFTEWQFIQYILPCFVTLIGQHATNSKTKPIELLAYTRFVHNLIQSFELKLSTKSIKGAPGTLIRYKPKDVPDFSCLQKVFKNLTVQLQKVESELGMLIYGTRKRMKRADTAEVMQAQIFFRLLKDSVKSTSFEMGESTISRWWGETLLGIVPRFKLALSKEVLLPTNPLPVNNLLRALAILHELKHIAAMFSFKPLDKLFLAYLDLADQRVKIMLGKQQSLSTINLDKTLLLEMQKLTVHQLLGVVLFNVVLCWIKEMPEIVDATKMFRLAQENVAVDKYIRRDLCGLRAELTPLLSDEDGNDLSLMTVDFAKKKASTFYNQITTLREAKQEFFISLLPVIPIKSCRCCAKFEVTLSMCWVCVDNDDFPDTHWFCSKVCEDKVLAEGHMQEHDHFLMLKLGLVSV
jgi:hypothetical protein